MLQLLSAALLLRALEWGRHLLLRFVKAGGGRACAGEECAVLPTLFQCDLGTDGGGSLAGS